jgi:hypothetical protein
MASPNLSDLAATTIGKYSSDIADNVLAHNALFANMKKNGGVKLTGGDPIYEQFSFQENSNGGSYSGYDELPTAHVDTITGAQFSLAQYAVPVAFSGREKLINAGPEQIVDLVDARVKVAESTMANLLNRHLYLDGTGNDGKNLTGLGAAVVEDPTTGTYGGINRANWSVWRNKKWIASTDGGGVATSSTIQTQWTQFLIQLTRGIDRPNLIVAAPAVYSVFMASLTPQQRFMSADKASAGFQAVDFQGIPVVFDTLASGITSTYAYFLNTKFLYFRPHKDRNMVALDDKQSFNQDATVKTLAWAGNLTSSGVQFQGVFKNA